MDAVTRYQQRLAARLAQARADMATRRDYLQEHFPSYLTLFVGARAYPELQSQVVACIADLHPWPIHWGYLSVWAEELAFAAAHTGQPRLLAHRADLLLRMGERDRAWQVAQQALAAAVAQHAVETVVSAGATMIDILRGQEQRAAMTHLHTELETQLTVLRPHSTPTAWTRAWTQFRLYSRYYGLSTPQSWLETVAETDTLLAALETSPDITPDDLIAAYFIGNFLYRRCGAARKALAVFQRKLQWERDLGYPHVDEQNAGNLALIYLALSEYDLADAAYRQRIAWCEQTHDWHFLATSLVYFSTIHVVQKRFAEAAAVLERALALAQQIDNAYIRGLAQLNIANLKLCQGDYPAAIAGLEAWIATQSPQSNQVALEKLSLSHAYTRLGQLDRARSLVADAREIAAHSDSEILQGLTLRYWANYQPLEARARLLCQALEILQRYERHLAAADCLLTLASLADTPEERARLWDAGAQLLAKLHATAWLAGASPEHPPFIVLTGS